MASSGHDSVSLDSEFQSRKQIIGANIQKILRNVRDMNRMITKIGTELENAQIQSQLHQITHITGQLAKDTCKLLEALNGLKTGPDNQRQWRHDRENLQEEFTNALNQYQDAQRQATKKEKELVKKLRDINFYSQEQGDLVDANVCSSTKQQDRINTQLIIEEEDTIRQLQEREQAISHLESSIVDLHTTFRALATMALDQGERIDSIEKNIDKTEVLVEEGATAVAKAEVHKNQARKKKLCLVVTGLILLAIIVGIIVWKVMPS